MRLVCYVTCVACNLCAPLSQAEGIELMILTLKERKYASRCALRVLDAALRDNGANCERFVDIRGFKTLFPLVGGSPPPQPSFAKGARTPLTAAHEYARLYPRFEARRSPATTRSTPFEPVTLGKKEREAAQEQFDASVLGIVCTMFHQLVGERRMRLLGKFAEEEMAKLEKLLALRHEYAEKVAAAEAALHEVSIAPTSPSHGTHVAHGTHVVHTSRYACHAHYRSSSRWRRRRRR